MSNGVICMHWLPFDLRDYSFQYSVELPMDKTGCEAKSYKNY